jgi:predicted nuclease of predicted toxin-antitoxin system
VDRIRFQFDEHVPHAVAEALRRRGIDVVTAGEAGLRGTPDAELLAHSHAAGRVLVTHDSDFLRLHREQHQHAGIAYCEQGARSIGQLVAGLVLIYEILEPGEMVGRVEFL